MEPDINQRISKLEEKIDLVYVSVEKTRKYFFWTMVITLALFILPLLALIFVIPSFISNYVGSIESLSQ